LKYTALQLKVLAIPSKYRSTAAAGLEKIHLNFILIKDPALEKHFGVYLHLVVHQFIIDYCGNATFFLKIIN